MRYSKRDLSLIGASLYLSEGTKARHTKNGMIYAIEFTNTDSRMMVLFMQFLRIVIKPEEKRIKAQLFYYQHHDLEQLIDYWSMLLKIPKSRFQKSIKIHLRNKYIQTSEWGIMKIRYSHKVHFLKLQGIIDDVFGGVA